jgi:hypothetical protein
MLLILQRPRHSHGHLLLLRAELEVACLGKNSAGRKNLLHLRDQIGVRPGGLLFNNGNHFKCDADILAFPDAVN